MHPPAGLNGELLMTIGRKIAFLGAGNMAGALIDGLLRAGACAPSEVMAMDVRAPRLEELASRHGIPTSRDLGEATAWADVVVLATKPQVFDRVLPAVGAAVREDALVVSIAAGVSIAAIEARMPAGTRVVRTMPNTPALVDAGATAIAAGTHAAEEDVALVKRVFDSVGVTVVLDEYLLDAVTGLSGSGPAYIFLIIEALADAGVKVGLHRDSAQLLAAQTVLGSAKLLLETGEHPGRLKDMVTSPGGTAIAGLHTLEAGGLRTTLINAVESAAKRSHELGVLLDERLAKDE
ncbi:MAG: pyrroline-5-carboxylate reductase [Sandaracinaceae bacterium]